MLQYKKIRNFSLQNDFLKLGHINSLKIDRETLHGLFLVSKDEKDVLLPKIYVKKSMKVGDIIDVFLYTDSEDRLIATTLTPKAKLNEFAFFEVVDVTSFGAFVDWNLPKDLLVPKKLQKTPFKIGEKRFLRVVYDEKTDRLVASEKFNNFFTKDVKGLHKYQEVDILVILKTPLGYKVIVNNRYEGLIYNNEIFQTINIGDTLKAYVKNIRKDNNIDLSLRKIGSKVDVSDKVVELLKQNNGIMPYNYKSDAQLIKEVFSMSKKKVSLIECVDYRLPFFMRQR
jgi:predicted RNA-binding protein (virulence factor B family)